MNDLSARIAALGAGKRELLLTKLHKRADERTRQPEIERSALASAPAVRFDLVVLGGGLAGQTLARQVKRARPSTSILVTERHAHPVPESAHKVGESTVEIGSHYFSKVLDLEAHMKSCQLPKAGLRYFFARGNNEDVACRVEMGATFLPPVASYQLDRGRFENMLGEENVRLGVEFWDRCKAGKVTRDGDTLHAVLVRDGHDITVAGRWIVDAFRPGGLAQTPTRFGPRCWPQMQCGLVPRRRDARSRLMVGLAGLAQPAPEGSKVAEHESFHGLRLLGVVHPTRAGSDQYRHRRRRRTASNRGNEFLRARAGLVEAV